MQYSDLDASRLLFGFTAAYHFLFVPMTLGLAALMAAFEGWSLLTGRPALRQVARFLSWPFVIHFVCGVLTGYPLRTQIELHWAGYAHVVQGVVGPVFAFEGQVAPFMFTLVAVVALGWHLKPVWHFLASTALAAVLVVQSTAILMINAWMQWPEGAEFVGSQARIASVLDLAGHPLVVPKVLHTIAGAWVLAGMFVVAICAWFRLRGRHADEARAGLRGAAAFCLVSLVLTALAGHWSGERLVRYQPMKFAAIEALWETDGHRADFLVAALPDMAAQHNRFELALPEVLGWVVDTREAPMQGLKALGEASEAGLPNVGLVFWAFRAMLAAWGLMLLLMLLVLWRAPDPRRLGGRLALWACVAALPLPWVAIEAGWIVCESGRQPWVITGVLTTAQAAGKVPAAEAMLQLLLAVELAAVMLYANVKLHLAHLRRGLQASALHDRLSQAPAQAHAFPASSASTTRHA
ncbi:MAG TPA: cytochrome ubiquinol oxidase subunit I [Rhizobacter sp.]